MYRKLSLIALLFSLFLIEALACTTAVISGRATADGRSMLWKVRDTEAYNNSMRYFDDGTYSYLGLVNSDDLEGKAVWGGTNSVGFAIMNSASFNVNVGDTCPLQDREGEFMKLALQTCASLADFERLLDALTQPRGLAAHFGVIDAEGGAAFYEVNNRTWTKYDANDAPGGYVLRTNFSQTGTPDVGYGFIRLETAQALFEPFRDASKLTVPVIMQQFSRCLIHPVLDVDYRKEYETKPYSEKFVASDDLITRFGTASNILIQGVKKGDSPDMSTLWVQVGFPFTSLSIPLWVRGGAEIPSALRYDESLKNSPLSAAATKWKQDCFPLGRSDGYHYLKIGKLVNAEGTGFVQRLEKEEEQIFSETKALEAKWRKKLPQSSEIAAYYQRLDEQIRRFYQ